jgi:hypothetical protein
MAEKIKNIFYRILKALEESGKAKAQRHIETYGLRRWE